MLRRALLSGASELGDPLLTGPSLLRPKGLERPALRPCIPILKAPPAPPAPQAPRCSPPSPLCVPPASWLCSASAAWPPPAASANPPRVSWAYCARWQGTAAAATAARATERARLCGQRRPAAALAHQQWAAAEAVPGKLQPQQHPAERARFFSPHHPHITPPHTARSRPSPPPPPCPRPPQITPACSPLPTPSPSPTLSTASPASPSPATTPTPRACPW